MSYNIKKLSVPTKIPKQTEIMAAEFYHMYPRFISEWKQQQPDAASGRTAHSCALREVVETSEKNNEMIQDTCTNPVKLYLLTKHITCKQLSSCCGAESVMAESFFSFFCSLLGRHHVER